MVIIPPKYILLKRKNNTNFATIKNSIKFVKNIATYYVFRKHHVTGRRKTPEY